jgi:hypothetical protein
MLALASWRSAFQGILTATCICKTRISKAYFSVHSPGSARKRSDCGIVHHAKNAETYPVSHHRSRARRVEPSAGAVSSGCRSRCGPKRTTSTAPLKPGPVYLYVDLPSVAGWFEGRVVHESLRQRRKGTGQNRPKGNGGRRLFQCGVSKNGVRHTSPPSTLRHLARAFLAPGVCIGKVQQERLGPDYWPPRTKKSEVRDPGGGKGRRPMMPSAMHI